MQFWYRSSALRWLFLPLAALFYLLSNSRRILFNKGLLTSVRVDAPVIVVGNITVGGNGKTPVVVYLCEQLKQRGFKPGVISRGYGGKSERYPLLLETQTLGSEAGDEPVLIYRRTGCPVVVSPKRAEAAQHLLDNSDVDVIISDDGLQHYHLQRDIEIVVVDGERRFGNGCYLPMGPLREGLSRINTVDLVINNGGEPKSGEYPMSLAPGKMQSLVTDDVGLETQTVNACAAIGHPPRFFNTLTGLGFELEKAVPFSDHYAYKESDFAQFDPRLPLLMTEKDAVKCLGFARDNWWYLPVDAVLPPQVMRQITTKIQTLSQGN